MKKLGKYLKPFALVLVAGVVRLFVQALCDLNLPNYMSDIVNVGIQQSGIDHRGDTGLTRALNEEFDLIILDLMLPEVDGFDICT